MIREYVNLIGSPNAEFWGILTFGVKPGIGLYLGISGAVVTVAGCVVAIANAPSARR